MASVVKNVDPTICPKCGTDVMVTGWTEEAVTTRSWMRFRGSGAVQISSSQKVADKAVCFECGAKLAATPAELLRVA
jgi:hypothetical protein